MNHLLYSLRRKALGIIQFAWFAESFPQADHSARWAKIHCIGSWFCPFSGWRLQKILAFEAVMPVHKVRDPRHHYVPSGWYHHSGDGSFGFTGSTTGGVFGGSFWTDAMSAVQMVEKPLVPVHTFLVVSVHWCGPRAVAAWSICVRVGHKAGRGCPLPQLIAHGTGAGRVDACTRWERLISSPSQLAHLPWRLIMPSESFGDRIFLASWAVKVGEPPLSLPGD